MLQYSSLPEALCVENSDVLDNGGIYKEVVKHTDYPQLTPLENPQLGIHSPEVIYPDNEQRLNNTPITSETVTGRICGLSRRIFYLVLILGLFIIIGAIAGGIGGGLSGRNNLRDTPDISGSPNATQSNINILSISKLASSNRTDSRGNAHRTVFFQDTCGAIIARRWRAQSRTWVTSNITEIMRGSTTPLSPLPGTPLASASCSWNNVNEVYLWFLTPDNYISNSWLETADAAPDNWKYVSLVEFEVQQGSQLAGMWQRCWADNCIGNWLVAYQTPDGDINVANASHWDNTTRAIESNSVSRNSSLSLAPQLNNNTIGIDDVVLLSEAPISGSRSDMHKSIYTGVWQSDNSAITDIPQPSSRLQFAVTLMHNFTQTMFMALLPNGTVRALWQGGDYTEATIINFRGGPVNLNFTAIAASEDTMFYGISGDEILEYEPDDKDPFSFNYVGRVFP